MLKELFARLKTKIYYDILETLDKKRVLTNISRYETVSELLDRVGKRYYPFLKAIWIQELNKHNVNNILIQFMIVDPVLM